MRTPSSRSLLNTLYRLRIFHPTEYAARSTPPQFMPHYGFAATRCYAWPYLRIVTFATLVVANGAEVTNHPVLDYRSMNRLHRWLCKSDYWKTTLADEILPWALKGIDLGENVLEVGPGPGLTTDILRQEVPRMTSIEIDPRLARSLKQRMDGT